MYNRGTQCLPIISIFLYMRNTAFAIEFCMFCCDRLWTDNIKKSWQLLPASKAFYQLPFSGLIASSAMPPATSGGSFSYFYNLWNLAYGSHIVCLNRMIIILSPVGIWRLLCSKLHKVLFSCHLKFEVISDCCNQLKLLGRPWLCKIQPQSILMVHHDSRWCSYVSHLSVSDVTSRCLQQRHKCPLYLCVRIDSPANTVKLFRCIWSVEYVKAIDRPTFKPSARCSRFKWMCFHSPPLL